MTAALPYYFRAAGYAGGILVVGRADGGDLAANHHEPRAMVWEVTNWGELLPEVVESFEVIVSITS